MFITSINFEYLKGYKVLEIELQTLEKRLNMLENIKHLDTKNSQNELITAQNLLKKIKIIQDLVPNLDKIVNSHLSELISNFKYKKDELIEVKDDKSLFLSIFTFFTSIVILTLIFIFRTVYDFYKKQELEVILK